MNEASGCFRLHNQIKHYDWGSPDLIPRLLGLENKENLPWAEMWMGSHPGAPSMAEVNGSMVNLGEFIAANPEYCLGKARQYGGLPFLFKLLAAGKPLSIQAHPNQAQAREGFERENRAGLALDDPKRNYKDPNHKPEIICALVPFTLMCGFREPDEIHGFLRALLAAAPPLREVFTPLVLALESGAKPLQNFFRALFNLTKAQRQELCAAVLKAGQEAEKAMSPNLWNLILSFAGLYPEDPAILAPLYLNLLTLSPGEAIFVRAGILHSYISGFGVELMANSDNVLRGGLTPKYVDIPELMNILDFTPYTPQILKAPSFSSRSQCVSFRYPTSCDEFSLSVMCGAQETMTFSKEGPGICIVTEGELCVSGCLTLKKGESVFIPAGGEDSSPLSFAGNYTLFAASLGGS